MTVENHIGQYKIVRTLGAGGMGTVYLGEHLLLGRRAAIKTLLPTLSSHREIVDRFFNEARAISAISDPGVVQIFDFGYHVDGTAYIVMEFLEGESLSARIERLGKLPLVIALRIARQIAASLVVAHGLGIIHRDLKPGNVFLIRDPEAQGGERTKILDFGICKLSEDNDGTVTQTGTMLGTPVYMSPEQCRGNGRIDYRSDIYSVGCALFHMLTGRPPFDCDSVGEFVAAHLKEDPPKPSQFAPELPEAVDALVLRCLEKAPHHRFASMTELQDAIEDVLASLSDQHSVMAVPAMAKTPLATGFKSAFDVNMSTSIPTMDQTPAPPADAWFVDSLQPVSAAYTDGWGKRRWSWPQRVALFTALLGGIVGGLAITSYAIDAEAAREAPVTSIELPVASVDEPELPVAATAVARESIPTATSPDETVAADEATDVSPATFTQDAPQPAKAKPERPPRPHVKKPPRPRRVVREAPVESPEDLYDTR